MRLDFFVATTTTLSRKDAKKAISSGRVTVNGNRGHKANTGIAPTDLIALDGEPLTLPGHRYFMLHKPTGVVSATTDADHPTALGLLPATVRQGLHIVGRLDIDTTGLLLLTDDGDWSHRITSPRVRCPKTYRVTLAEPLSDGAVGRLEQGVQLRNDPRPTRPAIVTRRSEREIDLTLSEGRYHQVKRMLAAVGNHVIGLHRVAIGDVTLDPALAPGEFRALTEQEIASIG